METEYHLSVTESEKNAIFFRASKAGLSVSKYIKRAIKIQITTVKIKQAAVPRTKKIYLRLKADERANLQYNANIASTSLASYIRHASISTKFGWNEEDLIIIDEDLISLGISINTFTKSIHTGKCSEDELFIVLPSIISVCNQSIVMLMSYFSAYSSTAATADDEGHFELWISQFYGIRNNFNQVRNHIIDKHKNHSSLTDLDLILQNVNIIINLIAKECGT